MIHNFVYISSWFHIFIYHSLSLSRKSIFCHDYLYIYINIREAILCICLYRRINRKVNIFNIDCSTYIYIIVISSVLWAAYIHVPDALKHDVPFSLSNFKLFLKCCNTMCNNIVSIRTAWVEQGVVIEGWWSTENNLSYY